ncbi:uncharacterized protein LOC135370639 [Ornithodoros turicata]|uniref:uncharacterized protein LOC135370639 n=1 Tax=Ornithodoros turicata TaxID=34597 RepID=UPI003138BD34
MNITTQVRSRCAFCGLVLLTLVAVCVVRTEAYAVRRSTNRASQTICGANAACGWHLYQPFDRQFVEYFPSPCTCPEGTDCIADRDDVSISCWVYSCKRPAEAETK